MTSTASFHKKNTEFYVSINQDTKMTYPGVSMWNGSSKIRFFIHFGTTSLGGCGGHPMRPKLNLKNKSQMSKPNEYTDNFKSNLTCIFLSVRAKFKKTLCPRTLCTTLHCEKKIEDLRIIFRIYFALTYKIVWTEMKFHVRFFE